MFRRISNVSIFVSQMELNYRQWFFIHLLSFEKITFRLQSTNSQHFHEGILSLKMRRFHPLHAWSKWVVDKFTTINITFFQSYIWLRPIYFVFRNRHYHSINSSILQGSNQVDWPVLLMSSQTLTDRRRMWCAQYFRNICANEVEPPSDPYRHES